MINYLCECGFMTKTQRRKPVTIPDHQAYEFLKPFEIFETKIRFLDPYKNSVQATSTINDTILNSNVNFNFSFCYCCFTRLHYSTTFSSILLKMQICTKITYILLFLIFLIDNK